uniref:Uncharacterized protein n=1 Tax=Avena sativa TaxID=4498 RepID=A0ACD6A3M5_AVESA
MARRRSQRLQPQFHASENGAGVMPRRRSPRLDPQIHASQDGAGVMARRRSPRLHPEIHASEDSAGLARRRSPRLHPQTHASEDGAGMAYRRRRRTSPASLPDNEDMLWEILLRLPPQPSSLPRASAVCKRWRGLVTDPRFLRRFRAHHRKPPLLGVFQSFDEIVLSIRTMPSMPFLYRSFDRKIELWSVLEPPDHCIPLHDIVTSIHSGTGDPTARVPPRPRHPHGHGAEKASFKFKLTDDIVEFDLDRKSLAMIKGPPDLNGSLVHQIIQTENGVVGLVVFSQGRFKMWERKANCHHGGATWLLQKTVGMHTILGLTARIIERLVAILGYDEENGVIFLYVDATVYMVQLTSMQSSILYDSNSAYRCYPFTSFYAPAGGGAGAGMLPLV